MIRKNKEELLELGLYFLITICIFIISKNSDYGISMGYLPNTLFTALKPYFGMMKFFSLIFHLVNVYLLKNIFKSFNRNGVIWNYIIPLLYFFQPLLIDSYVAPLSILNNLGLMLFLINFFLIQKQKYQFILPLYFASVVCNQSLVFSSLVFVHFLSLENIENGKLFKKILLLSTIFFVFIGLHYFTPIKIEELYIYDITIFATILNNFIFPSSISAFNISFINFLPIYYYVEFVLFLFGSIFIYYKFSKARETNFENTFSLILISGILGVIIFPWRDYSSLGFDWIAFLPSFHLLILIGLCALLGLLLEQFKSKYLLYASCFSLFYINFFFYIPALDLWTSNSALAYDSIMKIDQGKVRDYGLREKVLISYVLIALEKENYRSVDVFLSSGYKKFFQHPEFLEIALYLKTKNLNKIFDIEKRLTVDDLKNPLLLLALGEAYKTLGTDRYKLIFTNLIQLYRLNGMFEEAKNIEDNYLNN